MKFGIFFYEWRAIDFGLVIAFRHLSTGKDGEKCRPPDYTVFLQGTLTPLRSRNHVCHWVESPKPSNRRFEFATTKLSYETNAPWLLRTYNDDSAANYKIHLLWCVKKLFFLTTPQGKAKAYQGHTTIEHNKYNRCPSLCPLNCGEGTVNTILKQPYHFNSHSFHKVREKDQGASFSRKESKTQHIDDALRRKHHMQS